MRWNLTVWVYLRTPRRKAHLPQTMEGQVPEEVKEARRDEIMELQQEISLDKGNDRDRTGSPGHD